MKKRLKIFAASLMVFFSVQSFAVDAVTAVAREAFEAGFSEMEKQIINRYFGGASQQKERETDQDSKKSRNKKSKKAKGSKKMPPGLAKRDRLPPGLEKQLKKNGQLPPGLAKRELPADLESRLPPPPAGTERVIVDNDILLVEAATGLVVDILSDVILN